MSVVVLPACVRWSLTTLATVDAPWRNFAKARILDKRKCAYFGDTVWRILCQADGSLFAEKKQLHLFIRFDTVPGCYGRTDGQTQAMHRIECASTANTFKHFQLPRPKKGR